MASNRNRQRGGFKNTQKQEIMSKVKDIRQRQEMWMKERDQTLEKGKNGGAKETKSSYDSSKYSGSETPHSITRSTTYTKADILKEEDIRLPITPSPAPSSRAGDLNEDQLANSILKRVKEEMKISDQGGRGRYDYSEKSSPYESKTSQNKPSSYNSTHSDDVRNSHNADSLSDFEKFRLRLEASKKDAMAVKSEQTSKPTVQVHSEPDTREKPEITDKTAAQNPPNNSTVLTQESKAHPANHSCPCCSNLMSGDRDPVLIVPCGHSICSQCGSKLTQCPMCHCAVSKTTVNIMLKQIIADYSDAPVSMPLSHRENVGEKIHTLTLRLELMELHAVEAKRNIGAIEHELKTERKTIEDIGKEEERVREQVRTLEQQLQDLNVHKQEYVSRCHEIQTRLQEEKDNLQMVNNTVEELKQQIQNAGNK